VVQDPEVVDLEHQKVPLEEVLALLRKQPEVEVLEDQNKAVSDPLRSHPAGD